MEEKGSLKENLKIKHKELHQFFSAQILKLNKRYKLIRYKVLIFLFKSKRMLSVVLRYLIKSLPYIFWTIYILVILFFTFYFLPNNLPFNTNGGELVQIFVGLGAALAGVISIIFTISTFLIQNAASSFSAGFYDVVIKDRSRNIIYGFVFFSSLLFFLFAFLSATSLVSSICFQNITSVVSILILSIVFPLLLHLLKKIEVKINPFSGLKSVRDITISDLDKLKNYADKVASLTTQNPEADKENEGLFKAQIFNANKTILDQINNRLAYLFDFHDKSVSAKEKKLALAVIDVIIQIISKYFEVRSGSSLIVPSGILLATESDSQSFLTPNLERLVSTGRNYITEGNDEGASRIVLALGSLCFVANKIEPARKGVGFNENPVLSQCLGYLGQYLDEAIKYSNTETLFQGAKWLGSIGVLVADKHDDLALSTVFSSLFKVASYGVLGMSAVHRIVYQETFKSYTSILNKLIQVRYFNARLHIKTIFDHLTALLSVTFPTINNRTMQSSFDTVTGISSIFEGIQQTVFELIDRIQNTEDGRDRDSDKSLLFEVVENLTNTTRAIAEKIKNADHLLVGTISKTVSNICEAFIELSEDPLWNSEKNQLILSATHLLYQPYSFVYHASKIEDTLNGFDEIVEAYARVGLKALEKNIPELAKISVDKIHNISVQMLEKESSTRFGFTEPRIMVRACYIGIYALKINNTELLDKLKVAIKDFETKYATFWFSNLPEGYTPTRPGPDQLLQEVVELKDNYDDYSGEYGRQMRRQFMNRSEDLLISKIDKDDIDKFTLEIWNTQIDIERRSIF